MSGMTATMPVKKPLTKKRRRPKDNGEFVSFVGRAIRACSRRVAEGDVDALGDMVKLRAQFDVAIDDAVAGLRRVGYTWDNIANQLGFTKQAAHQRWGRLGDHA